jgi:SAM-dependent methyltransferase
MEVPITINWHLIWKYELLAISSIKDYTSNFGMDKLINCEKNYLFQYKDKEILDSTCGIGASTQFLKNKGYNVVGCDISDVAIETAKEFTKNDNIDFFVTSFQDLPENIETKFDIIYNDYILWLYDEELLKASVRGIYNSLSNDGKFIFFGINEQSDRVQLELILQNQFYEINKEELLCSIYLEGKIVEYWIKRELYSDYILVEFIFITKSENQIIMTESTKIIEAYKWTWDDIQYIFKEIGFKTIYSPKNQNNNMVIAEKL